MACICYGFFIMLGTVGWRASLMFVRHIYKVNCRQFNYHVARMHCWHRGPRALSMPPPVCLINVIDAQAIKCE